MPRKGQSLTEEQKQKIRESRFNLTPQQRENIAASQRGKKASDETKSKMSASHMGHSVSKEAREAIGNAHRGKTQTRDAIEKMRQSKLGKRDSEETKLKKSLSHMGDKNHFYGKTHSEETIIKMRVAKSEETKERMSKAKIGIIPKNIEILKSACVGKPMSESHYTNHAKAMKDTDTREKMSISQRGENNPNWNGGVTPLYNRIRECSKYYEWRDAVYDRDNYTDVITGERGNHNLNAHHIVPFAVIMEKNNITTLGQALACAELWDVNNGITMIDKNHIAYHARTNTPE